MRVLMAALAAAALLGGMARASDPVSGRFDYWVLAVSWLPSWCALEGEARGDRRCGTAQLWGLHGLWPQYEGGWPEFCRSPHRDPTRAETGAQADLFGSSGAAWHQWRKHGRCSGLMPGAYFAASAEALEARILPDLAGLAGGGAVPAIRIAGLAGMADPASGALSQVASCRDGHFLELRICLDREFRPRDCAADVIRRACRGPVALPAP